MSESQSDGHITEIELQSQDEYEYDYDSADESEDHGHRVGTGTTKTGRYEVLESSVPDLKRVNPGNQLGVNKPIYMVLSCRVCLSSFAINSRWVLCSNLLYFLGQACFLVSDIIDLRALDDDISIPDTGMNVSGGQQEDIDEEVYAGDPYYHWYEDIDTVQMYLCYAGAILFLLNPISDFMGSWAEEKVSQIHESLHYENRKVERIRKQTHNYSDNVDVHSSRPTRVRGDNQEVGSGDERDSDRITHKKLNSGWWCCNVLGIDPEEVNWDMQVARLFFVGSVLQLWQTHLDWEDPDVYYYLALDIFASHLFILVSGLAVFGWKIDRDDNWGGSRQRLLLSCKPSKTDWSGWGDWSFFVGSLLDAAISYMENFPMKVQVVFALVSDFLWMLNAILYTIGYIYGQDVRKRFANKYYTSLVHVEESDSDDEDEDENTTEPGMNKDQDEGVITEDSDSESLSNTDSNASEPLQSSIELSVI
eukprot:CAMPEP_0204824086 /NCGR_PEP_ID=MMETSP1346-20131115/2135_1 /ASSEMBLY_ACC=CAM_ASM_000771 /TAXON_ID=215587 /ORGANISM="Aplanochytrium stocchinoi, Strain GSBS06" /LENGTH=476 /DNA_ID=CAMNT_0051951045 /DNA_START=283 /DNA_END=1713 /DNA_ORIENTATION=+